MIVISKGFLTVIFAKDDYFKQKIGCKKLPNSYHSEIKVIFIEKNYWSYKK